MGKQCFVTGRKASTGNRRSHALNSTKRRWNANLQKVRILVDKSLGFCTCFKIW